MPADMVTPGTSTIAGTGLFAGKHHDAGDVLIELDHAPNSVEEFGLLNHSCDPSLGWRGAQTLVALRDIPDGMELTVDYATAIDHRDWVMWCHCNTYRCRQVIEGNDWQIPQLQQRYHGHWTPGVQRRIDDA